MHILPQLRELEARFPDEVVVIGVHTAKFPNERDQRHLAAAVARLGIDHPVINDAEFAVWQAYAVRAWPTLMFVDPEGKVIGKHEGEFAADELAPVLAAMLDEFRAAGLLRAGPLPGLRHPADAADAAVAVARPLDELAWPGKALADAARDRLVVADSGHHRVIVASLAGEVRQVYGRGTPGFDDGPASTATFDSPQGLALDGDWLYVADTGNHALRRIDLANGLVTTLAGTGDLARRPTSGGDALATPLRSPWDVALAGGTLWIAMAGSHQLWSYRPGGDEIRRAVGSGHEGLKDAALAASWLAQPSGIAAYDGGRALLFADSETSAIRVADLPGIGDGSVRTLLGEGLFVFGDVDGPRDVARLQHPLGVTHDPESGMIYLADAYNNAIKRFDPATGVVSAWLGSGEPALRDGVGRAAAFFEPAGISVAGGALWIADTNNHAVRRADLTSGTVTTVMMRGLGG